MVTLQTEATTGTKCPVCGNYSVFKEDVYKLWFFYSHTVIKCEMDSLTCTYEDIKIKK
jgi:hypothetical protein